MKKYTLSYLMVLVFACAFSEAKAQATDGYILTGTIKGVRSGKVKITLANEEDRISKTLDSGRVTNGKFVLKGKIATPVMVSILFVPGNFSSQFFLEKGAINVIADTTGSQHYDYTKYGYDKGAVLKKLSVTGSKTFNDWQKYQNDPGQKQFDPAFAQLQKAFKAAGDNVDAEYRVRDQMDSVNKLKQAWQKKKIDEYVASNPNSVAGTYMFFDLYRFVSGTMPYPVLDSMLNKFTGEAKASVYYESLSRSRTKLAAVQVGQVAPDFTLLKPDSSSLALSSLRGKYILIDFWASWCHPCRQAIPHWKELYGKYHDKGFDILSVSDDNKWGAWTKAMDDEKMPWNQVIDRFSRKNMPADVGSLYMTTFIPFYVLLDKEGKILAYTGDEAKIESKLNELFKN
ncbi:MAG: AhpC/TSA family protein [Mucilaginibacter sp.]|nr:AhpC/TSA family protein [Mucilaginibacter sp.]